MGQRTDQYTRSRTDDAERTDGGDRFAGVERTASAGDTGDRSLGERAARLFSPRFFVLALLAFGAVFVAGNAVVPFVPVVGGLAGIAAFAFVLGLVASARRYLETAAAGAVAAGLATWLSNLFLSVIGNVGVPIALAGAGGGVLAALVGYYFGRDLRDGLTREI